MTLSERLRGSQDPRLVEAVAQLEQIKNRDSELLFPSEANEILLFIERTIAK